MSQVVLVDLSLPSVDTVTHNSCVLLNKPYNTNV